MKRILSPLLALALLATIPASFTSCREDAPSFTHTTQVTVTNEFSKVVEAINNGSLKNEQAIQKLTEALNTMNRSQGEKLQDIIEALTNVNNTLDAKLAALAAAIASPGTNLATKLDAIATAIKNHVIAQDKLVEKITQSIDKLGGTLSSKMGEINQAIQDASKSTEEKFNLLLGVINSSTMTLGEKLQTIQTALASNKEILDKLDKAMAELLPTVKDNNERLKVLEGLSAKVDEILKEVRAGREDVAKATKEILAKLDELIALLGGVTPPPTPPTGETVDLGLPSGLLWSTCFLGATTPEGYGDYYAWGETEPKQLYTWATYNKLAQVINQDPEVVKFTKYCIDPELGFEGFVDDKLILEADDDAAKVKLGGAWRMPTHGEALELINNCTWTLETINGVARWHGQSKINQQSIYFSVNGTIKNDFSTQGQDSFCFWTTSLASDTPLSGCVAMSPFAANLIETERFVGMGIRPVRPKNP